MSLLVVLVVMFTSVVLVSCLAKLLVGEGFTNVAGTLHLGS